MKTYSIFFKTSSKTLEMMNVSQLSTVSHMLKVLRDRHFALLATCILTPLVLVALSVSNHLGCSVFDWLNSGFLVFWPVHNKQSTVFDFEAALSLAKQWKTKKRNMNL